MPTAQADILAKLFAPGSKKQFLKDYWPDTPFSSHGSPSRLPQYLRCETLSSFTNLAIRYRGRIAFGNASAASTTAITNGVSPALLRNMGLSLYLPDLDTCIPGTAEFLHAIEQELGAKTGVARIGAFAAAVDNGVTPHYDAEEVISVQLEGEKRFYIAPMAEISCPYGMQFGPGYEPFDELYPQMDAGIPKIDGLDWTCIDMQPGSVLFLPRGTWHRTEAAADSLSISIIVRQPPAFEDVLEQLRSILLRSPAWRRPLYGMAQSGTEAFSHIAASLTELPGIIGSINPDDIADAHLSEPQRMAHLNRDSWLQRIPNACLLLSPRGDLCKVLVKVRTQEGSEREIVELEVPSTLQPAMQWLAASERPLCAAELAERFPGAPSSQLDSLCNVLVRAGYLKLLTHAPFSANGR